VINYKGVLTKEEMIGRFGCYDVMLFPAWEREPFGFTVSEAAAAGCISIMTSGIGAAEWFFDGVDCLKISRSVSSLEKAMLQILETRPETLTRMKNAARTNARVNLAVNRWARVIEAECTGAAVCNAAVRAKMVSQVEAAFLVMSDLWRSQLDRQ
jgi:glycosyltransferase involved in cell wall biosynthesis